MRTCFSLLAMLILTSCGSDVGGLTERDDVLPDDESLVGPVGVGDGSPNPTDGDAPGASCPAFPPAAVYVTVQAAVDLAVCDAVVEIRDGDFVKVAQRGGPADACMYFSVFERAGTYDVVVLHADFAPITVTGVVVDLDACGHAITTDVAVDLMAGGGLDEELVEPEPTVDDPEPDTESGTDPEEPVVDPEPTLVCPPDEAAHSGHVVLSTADSLAILSGIVCVAGDVRIEGSLTSVALPALRRVMGDFVVENSPSLGTLTVRALRDVGGDVVLKGTALDDTDGIDGLRNVGGMVRIESNSALEVGDLAITDVGGLAIVDNPILERARMRALVHVDTVAITANPLLDDMDLRALASVSGDVAFDLARFGDLDLRVLASVGGDFTLSRASDLDSFTQLGVLASVGGDLTVRELPSASANAAAAFVGGIDVAGETLVCSVGAGVACP